MGTQKRMAELSEEEWKEIAGGFRKLANFPNCLCALDGKHVRIIKSTKIDLIFFNNKDFFSILLMTICDSNYCFTFEDIGAHVKNVVILVYLKTVLFTKNLKMVL